MSVLRVRPEVFDPENPFATGIDTRVDRGDLPDVLAVGLGAAVSLCGTEDEIADGEPSLSREPFLRDVPSIALEPHPIAELGIVAVAHGELRTST
jgi:hypothetical protein